MAQNIIYIDKPVKKINRNDCGMAIVKIDKDAADILESFAYESGLSFSKIASNFIKYASNETIIREREVIE